MLRVREIGQVGVGFGEKVAGLGLEFVGTVVGNERLKDSGRQLEEAANERLRAVEEEVKAAQPHANRAASAKRFSIVSSLPGSARPSAEAYPKARGRVLADSGAFGA